MVAYTLMVTFVTVTIPLVHKKSCYIEVFDTDGHLLTLSINKMVFKIHIYVLWFTFIDGRQLHCTWIHYDNINTHSLKALKIWYLFECFDIPDKYI